MTTPTFGERFRALREDRGWSISEASQHTGLARSYVYQIERDQNSPTLRVIEMCAAAFELSVLELLAPLYGSPVEMDAAWSRLNDAIQAQAEAGRAVRAVTFDMARQDMVRQFSGRAEEVSA